MLPADDDALCAFVGVPFLFSITQHRNLPMTHTLACKTIFLNKNNNAYMWGARARVDDQFGKKTNGSQGHPKTRNRTSKSWLTYVGVFFFFFVLFLIVFVL